jgi:hypothetical protein
MVRKPRLVEALAIAVRSGGRSAPQANRPEGLNSPLEVLGLEFWNGRACVHDQGHRGLRGVR